MKKFFKSLALATVLVLSFSCSKESPVDPGNNPNPSQPGEPIVFSVQEQKAYIAEVTKQFTENFNEPKIYDAINVLQYAYNHYLNNENYGFNDIKTKFLSIGISGLSSHKSKGTKRNVKETADSTIIENCTQSMETFPITDFKGTFTADDKEWKNTDKKNKTNLIFNFNDSTGTKHTFTINAKGTVTNAYICKYNRTRTLKNENVIDGKLTREYDVQETLVYISIPSQIGITLKKGNVELLSANINSDITDINSYFDNPNKCSISSKADIKVNNMGFKLNIDFKNGYTKTYIEGYMKDYEKYIDAEIEGNYMLVGDVIVNIDLDIKDLILGGDISFDDIEIENNMTLNDSIKDLKYCIGIMDSVEIRGMIKDPYKFISDFENGIKTTDSTETLNYVEKFNSNMSNSLGYRNINYTPNIITLKEVKKGDDFTINPFIEFNGTETMSAAEFFDAETFAHVIEYLLKYELLPDIPEEYIR
ncbi:MAG: hypothetical protein MJY71_06400 [Bacteroidaceae bacterium]|nr:hypothetical protein [Bacteroidaceae bacterium]